MFGRITFYWFSVEFELEMGFALSHDRPSKKGLDGKGLIWLYEKKDKNIWSR
jgi:hypothetical protein